MEFALRAGQWAIYSCRVKADKAFSEMKRANRVGLLIAMISVLVLGMGNAGTWAQKDSIDEGHPAVREFAKRMAGLKSIMADVECTISRPEMKMTAPFTGSLEARGESYALKMDGIEIYSDGQSRWQYMPEEKEVTVTTLSDVSTSPLDRPMQLFQEYSTLFKVRYRGEHVKDGVRYLDFTFYPRDLRQPYTQIHVSVVASTYMPYKMTYMGKDGVSYLLTLKNVKPNAPVRSSFNFESQGYKGVEVIDLR